VSKYLYTKAVKGDAKALEQLLSSEQSHLYDYLLRMTGERSIDVGELSEIFSAVTPAIKKYDSFGDFRKVLYSTARKFNFQTWNASLQHLVPEISEEDSFELMFYGMPGNVREVTLLIHRLGFDETDAADIMEISEDELNTLLDNSRGLFLDNLEEGSTTPMTLAEAVVGLKFEQSPESENAGTMAISQVVAAYNDRGFSLRRVPLMTIFFALILVLVLLYFDVINLPTWN